MCKYTLVCVGFFMLTIKDFFTLLLSCKEKNPFDSRANMGGGSRIWSEKNVLAVSYLPRVATGWSGPSESILSFEIFQTWGWTWTDL